MSYHLTLTADEHKALAWVADRYVCAGILYDGLEHTGDDWDDWGGKFDIPEHVAHNYILALPEENGDDSAILPPCVGGSLGDKLVRLWEEVD